MMSEDKATVCFSPSATYLVLAGAVAVAVSVVQPVPDGVAGVPAEVLKSVPQRSYQ